MTFGQGQEMTLTLKTNTTSLAQYVVCIYQLSSHRLQNFLKNLMFSLFFHGKAYVTKIDIAVKYVKVNPRSCFIHTMMSQSPSFIDIGPPVPENLYLYHIWAWWPSWSCNLDHYNKLWFPLPNDAPYEVWL